MKKNLKKVVALALAALTVSTMTVPTFAAKMGDIDGSGILTANDAALVLAYAKNSDSFGKKFGQTIFNNVKNLGTVTLASLKDDIAISATDAAAILQKVRSGKSFAEYIKSNENYTEADKELVDNKFTTSQSVVFTYGKSAVNVPCAADEKVFDALDEALDGASPYIQAKAGALMGLLRNFNVGSKTLGSKEGWAVLGETIAQDQTAFAALYPENVDKDYLDNFVANIKKAFPAGTDTAAVKAAIAAKNVTSDGVTLTTGSTTITEPAEVLSYIVTNILYADKTAADYENIVITFDNGKAAKVTKMTVQE